ncbi:hypothetical protein CEXT_424171 [Caerostris extrusa]|uniref:Uncharacterized protein n=1 Tax=Caerostris extrusa TaxID=172846 RepID=A0AAV4UVE8_CAEEX|nr:hypothetical protein CEXT_424171 [Caerostris extrusa]
MIGNVPATARATEIREKPYSPQDGNESWSLVGDVTVDIDSQAARWKMTANLSLKQRAASSNKSRRSKKEKKAGVDEEGIPHSDIVWAQKDERGRDRVATN